MLLVTLGVAWIAYAFPPLQYLEQYVDAQALGSWVRQNGFNGIAIFIALGALTASVGLPRQLVALIAGYSFGLLQGLLLAITSVSLGALLTFWFARFIARPWVRRRFPEAVAKIDDFAADQAFLKILTIRFLPLGTNMATNLAAGTTSLSARIFFAASFLGFLPQTAIFVLGGNGLNIDSTGQIVLGGVLLLISSLLCLVIYRRHKTRQSSAADS
ncbi:MAG: VTT domain-containing protein [Amphritea sp.]